MSDALSGITSEYQNGQAGEIIFVRHRRGTEPVMTGKPLRCVERKCLFYMVGVTGFEPATPTSRKKSQSCQPVIANDKP
jgi:hypothetical protein